MKSVNSMMMRFLIFVLSVLWGAINGVRRWLYSVGLFRRTRLTVPVISVGNLEAGGTGKTPVVIALAREALVRGLVPLVLTRGYGGRWSQAGGMIGPGDALVDPALCGDEASLIQRQVPGAWIGVGADRVRGFERVMGRIGDSSLGPSSRYLAILDDGHQHLQIHHDVDVLVLTGTRPWQKIFREWPMVGAMDRSIRIWSKGASPRQGDFGMRFQLQAPAENEKAEKLWMVSGIGSPDSFLVALRSAGWQVVRRTDFRDHARYSAQWVADVLERARKDGLRLAITGKDWVKWSELGVSEGEVRVFEPLIHFDPPGFLEAVLERVAPGTKEVGDA